MNRAPRNEVGEEEALELELVLVEGQVERQRLVAMASNRA